MQKHHAAFVFMVALALAGCASPGAPQDRLVSKPNMQFSRSAIYAYSSRITSQLQPGLALTAGAQPSTCTLCR